MKKYKKIYDVSQKKSINLNETIEKRYIFLIGFIIFIMLILLVNLFNVQVLKYETYSLKVNKMNEKILYSNSTPRGRIYDRKGRIIVDNKPVKVIFYKKQDNSTKEEIDLAYKISKMIDLEYDVSEINLKKFWILTNKEDSNKLITEEEYKMLEERRLTNEDINKLKLERIKDLNYTEDDKKAIYIYNLMNKGYSFDEKVIKKYNVSDKEYALIAENSNELKGFDVRLDWERYYPYGDTFKSILGSVSSSEAGIPYELKEYYLDLGYSLNDRVGISFLEYQYESILKGEKVKYQLLEDGTKKILNPGKRGKDIVLSIDIELQKEIEKILVEEIINAKKQPNTKYYDHSFVVMTDVKTGEILAMAGKQVKNENEIYDYTSGITTTPITAGSIVKGASHAVGYKNNAIKIGEIRNDGCIKIKDTPIKCSWRYLGNINDITSLKYSSNVYQFKTAINVGKGNYIYDKSLNINPNAFDLYRKTFKEFGLGVKTNIDLPVESLGYTSDSTKAGHLLDFSIGQFDTYTPIQLSQYINTIANDGNRLKPHLLKAVYNPTNDGLTNLDYEIKPEILNKVDLDDKYMERIKLGFREVMTTSGTGSSYVNYIYKAAGKTGTSESFIDTDNDGMIDTETISNTFGAYAPYDNPKVSFVVISPNIYYKESDSTYKVPVNRIISNRISQKYFEIYK